MSAWTPHTPILYWTLHSVLYTFMYTVMYTVLYNRLYWDFKVPGWAGLFPWVPCLLDTVPNNELWHWILYCTLYSTNNLHFSVNFTVHFILHCTKHKNQTYWRCWLKSWGIIPFLHLLHSHWTLILQFTVHSTVPCTVYQFLLYPILNYLEFIILYKDFKVGCFLTDPV